MGATTWRWMMGALGAVLAVSLGCSDEEPFTPGQFTLTEPEFTAEPGEEFTYCMRMPIPGPHRGDDEMYVTGVESNFPFGTHHFFTYYSPTPPEDTLVDSPAPCIGDDPKLDVLTAVFNSEVNRLKEGDGATFGAPEGPGGYTMQPGYAIYLPTTSGFFVTDHHALNLTDETLEMGGEMTFHYAEDKSEVEKTLRFMFCENLEVEIPARSKHTLEVTCTFPEDVEIAILSSHAHLYLEKFEQRIYDGEKTLPDPIYTSTDWDSPDVDVLEEPLHLEAGQGITVTCHYNNTTDSKILYGIGDWGEMCVAMNMHALPVEQEDQYGLGAQVEQDQGIAEMERTYEGVFH